MRTEIGEALTERHPRNLWNAEELTGLFDQARGNPNARHDLLTLARSIREGVFGDGHVTALRFEADEHSPTAVKPVRPRLTYLQTANSGTLQNVRAALNQLSVGPNHAATVQLVTNDSQIPNLRSFMATGVSTFIYDNSMDLRDAYGQSIAFKAFEWARASGFRNLGFRLDASIGFEQLLRSASELSNFIVEELGLRPHTLLLSGLPIEAGEDIDTARIAIALLRLSHPYSLLAVEISPTNSLSNGYIDAGANVLAADLNEGVFGSGEELLRLPEIETELRHLYFRALPSVDSSGGLISEFRTKATKTYMLVRRPAASVKLGNNSHAGLFPSKDPETVVLVEGQLRIESRHPRRHEPEVVLITASMKHPAKLTVPRDLYHEVVAERDSILIEFSSLTEDTTDSFPWMDA